MVKAVRGASEPVTPGQTELGAKPGHVQRPMLAMRESACYFDWDAVLPMQVAMQRNRRRAGHSLTLIWRADQVLPSKWVSQLPHSPHTLPSPIKPDFVTDNLDT